jgi:hypothetical protein
VAIELQADGLGNFLTHSSISVRPIYLDICPQRCDNRFKCLLREELLNVEMRRLWNDSLVRV